MIIMMAKLFKVRIVSVVGVCILLCMLSINTGQCRPSEKTAKHKHYHPRHRTTVIPISADIGDEVRAQIRPCFENSQTMELCQRCAKESKANNVFPLCCANIDEVQSWCKEYIYFGLVP